MSTEGGKAESTGVDSYIEHDVPVVPARRQSPIQVLAGPGVE